MRNPLLVTCLVFLVPLIVFSQPNNFYNLDYGLKFGAANYIGDIGGYNTKARSFILDMKMQETKGTMGFYIRDRLGNAQMSKRPWSIEAELNWIRIAGADSLTTKFDPRKLRNLTFRNDIFQFNTTVEWNFFENLDLGHKHFYEKTLNAYISTGISIFYQDPYAYNPFHNFGLPTWVSLHGLRTENQLYKKPFHLIQLGIPWSAGVNYTFLKQYRIGLSITWTETFTDYLDGVSGDYPTQAQWNTLTPEEKYFSNRIESRASIDPAPDGLRGNMNNNDSFLTLTINVGYVIKYPSHEHNRSTGGFFKRKRSRSKF